MNIDDPIAIIGLACRFPDAPDVDTFKENLLRGHDAIRSMSADDISREGIDPELIKDPNFVNAGTLIKNPANFDYAFFNLSPKEAELMDPQHRLFLEECRKLLDVANLTRDTLNIGVYAGCRQSSYQMLLPPLQPENITQTETFQQLMGNDKDYLATRVSYQLNLIGPAMSIQTACSTSLVAVHQACQALRNKECNATFAGGVGVSFPQGVGYKSSAGMIFSNDGKCRPFSAEGTGIVAGNGLGVVALKRLQDAIDAGDTIHAVIKGSALSNDGKAKLGFTAPGKSGQQQAIKRALKNSGLDPNNIGLLEAHGTGTPLGDLIEVQAIEEIYQAADVPDQNCAIGSVKGNVGHLDTAAGIASLIKAVIAVREGVIPPSLHCKPSNPAINFKSTPFYLAAEQQQWPEYFKERIAAVSSFGIGGTNCHMLVQQAPKQLPKQGQTKPGSSNTDAIQVLAISNHHNDNILQQAQNYVAALKEPQLLNGQCRTAALKRQHFPSRIALYGKDQQAFKQALTTASPRGVIANPKTAWVFSGQGSQKTGMGKNLYASQPVFKEAVDHCCQQFAAAGIANIKQVMFEKQFTDELNATLYTQSALFTWQYAMSVLLQHWGINPDFVVGHSIGEFAASVIAGYLSIEPAIQLVAHRALLMQNKMPAGSMLAVRTNKAALDKVLKEHDDIALAASNSDERFTISGSDNNIQAIGKDLEKAGILFQKLNVNRAFHSAATTKLKSDFYAHTIDLSEANSTSKKKAVMYSSFTTEKVASDNLDTDYWFGQLSQPVKFYQAIQSLATEKPDVIIEIGPDGSFCSLLKQQQVFAEQCVITTVSQEHGATLIAELYCLGYNTPLEEYYAQAPASFAEMPPLIFSPNRCWPELTVKPSQNYPAASTYTTNNTRDPDQVAKHSVDNIQLWQWQWQTLPPLYQRQLQQLDQKNHEHWCVIGNCPTSITLTKTIQTLGHSCDRTEQVPDTEYDRLIDVRLFTLEHDFNNGIQTLQTAAAQLITWGHYADNYPDCQIITLIANPVLNADDSDNPHQDNSLWAFMNLCRTYANERPHLKHSCLDIGDNDINENTVKLLQQVNELGTVLSLRKNDLCSLTIQSQAFNLPAPLINWQSKHFTLIAGLGSVGLGLAQWLVSEGCNKLVFLLRQAPNTQQQALVDKLTTQGTTVYILQASLTSQEDLSTAFSNLDIIIDSVFHTAHAGVQKLHPLEDTNAFNDSLPVKITGSLNLYQQLKNQPLRFFCMFSSVTSVMAMPGASGYATANAWQDAYAAYLRANEVPALTISWGQLMLSREFQHITQVDKNGITALSSEQAFSMMARLIENNLSGVSPIIYDAATLGHTVEILPATLPCLKSILSLDNKQTRQTLPDINDLDKLSNQEKEKLINQYIHQLISERLKFKYHQLDPEQSLTEQGVDSLVFLELIQIINQQYRLNLPATIGYEYGTVNALSAYITSQITHDDIAFSEQNVKTQMTIIADPENRYEPFPLTDLQQAYWIGRLDGLSLGSVACHQYVELELENLDHERFEAAWNKLIQRHEMMRCIILPSGQNQILQEVDSYSVVYRDLTTLASAERDKLLLEVRERMSFQVFNPQQWPLFELSVSQLSNHISLVHLDMDLLVFDIQSFRIIYAELAALLEDENAQLPELTLSFRDYLLAEKKQEESASWQQTKAFWMERLEQIPNAPDLPIIKQTSQQERAEYRTLDHRLSPTAWQQLRKYANKFGLTASCVLLTAYTQALALYSRSPEFTLNITYFNRKNVHEQIMDVCGDFTSLMLLPVTSQPQQLFSDTAKRIQGDLWDALKHRDFNGIRVMRELGRHRKTGADGIEMPVVFTSLIGMDFDDPSRPEWQLMSKQVFEINQTPQVWIDYQASKYGGALMTRWFVTENLFETQIIEGLFSVYTQFLEWLAADESHWQQITPDLRMKEEQYLSQQLMSQQPLDTSLLMPQLVQQQFNSVPDKPAIIFQDDVFNYDDLGCLVNQFAHYLIEQGLQSSAPVVVLIPKQALSIVAALAIQSAGGCYVPVNSEYDNERLQGMITELTPFAILTTGKSLSTEYECPVINLKTLDISGYDKTPPVARQTADDLAYIIYTSGSTGLPKGVMANHMMPLNTLLLISEKLGLGVEDRALALSPFHHDLSIIDTYSMLINGGSVIFPDTERLFDAEHWLTLVEKYQPTFINAVPAFISMLLDAQASTNKTLPAPRHIIMGGDWIPIPLVKRLKALWPDCQLHSIGGPTETAICSAYYTIDNIDPTWTSIPYGKPLANQSCYLLTPDGRDCPVGIVGEICTGGMASFSGYWQDPALTEKRYRNHPLTGERLFHTGDLGRLCADGNIEILGRLDNQINHNGLRMEPGEIEAAINQHPDIHKGVVIYAGNINKQLHGIITKTVFKRKEDQSTRQSPSNSWLTANEVANEASQSPPNDFDVEQYSARFNRMEQLSTWTMLATIQSVGLLTAAGQCTSANEVCSVLNVSENYQKIPLSWLNVLVEDGFINTDKRRQFVATDKVLETERCQQLREQLDQEVTQSGTQAEQRLWSLYTRSIDKIDQLLTGEFNPLSLMFEDGKTDFAESHYRENIVSQHFNHVAGKTAGALLKEKSQSGELRILEFGAGIGSVTHDILKHIPSKDFIYDFTDISPYFLDNAREMFSDWPQLRYSHFNINEEPGLQQLQLGTYNLIIGTNVLHDAINVHASIAYLRCLLKSDGHLMLVEGTMNPRFQMVSLGFVEGLTHYEDERMETYLPMISAPLWKKHLLQGGFNVAASFPPENHLVEKMNYHLIITENNGEDIYFNSKTFSDWLRKKLPEAMIPTRWYHLANMPLSGNGKIDRSAMEQALNNNQVMEKTTKRPLQSEHARLLANIWQAVLNTEVDSEEDNFFTLGGDSLLMTRLINKIQYQFQVAPDLVTLLRYPTLGEQANLIEATLLATPKPEDNESHSFEEGVI